jgi:hypothetical protein
MSSKKEFISNSFSYDNSSSSDATSIPDENQARFLAAQSLCATVTIFHRMGLPNLSSSFSAQRASPVIAMNPILIDAEA